MTGRARHGGIYSALSGRDINTIKDFYKWASGPGDIETGTGLSPDHMDDLFTDNVLFKEDDDLGNIDVATLEEIEDTLKDAIETLVGDRIGKMVNYVVPDGKGGYGWSSYIQKGNPEVEVSYAVHKRWAAKLQKILDKIKAYRYRIHNKELS